MPADPSRRSFLAALLATGGLHPRPAGAADAPATDPLAAYKLKWTAGVKWGTVVDVSRMNGETADEKLELALAVLVLKGGGVAYFPAGTYKFRDSVKLPDGVVLRGADPGPVASATNEKYSPPTVFEFPKYEPALEGDGTDIRKAFKGVYLSNPQGDSNAGVVNIGFNRGHVHFADAGPDGKFAAGKNRFVVGCVFRNAAVADPAVPNVKLGQKAWQRFTARHHAAVDVRAAENLLVANNRLPRSGDDDFTMNGYVLTAKGKEATVDGVVFDYDNRPGLYVNHYGIGGAGGTGPDGTPETHPHGFRKGVVIRDNYVFHTGRVAVGFCGDGVVCKDNVTRMLPDVWRPTATGQAATFGSSTNDNRAVEMRGWRWEVTGNDYEVYRNWASDRKYHINDGEGLMHEDHVNSTVLDSVLSHNRGNAYLSVFKTAGVDGLVVEGNEVKFGNVKGGSAGGGVCVFVDADRVKGRFPCRRVSVVKNTVSGGGIRLAGDPSEKNVVKGNRHVGDGKARLQLRANADAADNDGFEVEKGK